jgi:hypothetical protein
MSQSDLILAALKHGDRLTPLDALTRFQCMRLASRISDLKQKGEVIHTRTIKTDSGKSVAEYWMDVERLSLFDDHIIIERARYGGLQ